MASTIPDTLHMPPSFSCKRNDLHCSDFHSTDLGEVIKHLLFAHHITSIERPGDQCVPDSNGYLWYCSGCKRKCKGKSDRRRRNYGTNQAM
jgi:hypothetical protein